MRNKEEIIYLLEQYINQRSSVEEYDRLFKILNKESETGALEQAVRQIMEKHPADPGYNAARWEPIITKILQQGRLPKKKHYHSGRWLILTRAAAAAIILLLGIGAWYGIQNNSKKHPVAATELKRLKNDILPGGNKAVLTLGNGTNIILDSTHNGLLSIQGSTKIVKINSGLLTYNASQRSKIKGQRSEIQYNTITTPRGGQFKVILQDGSKVWLNAASSIRFPTVFSGNDRHVFIKGEAYFEVAKDEVKPFIVSVNDMQVKVLGTQFNIMAYGNEPAIKTTLLEGAVQVSVGNLGKAGRQTTILKPRQQVQIDEGGQVQLINNVDISEAVAWKDGLFQFSDDGVAHIMRQIARWYNVEVVYENGIPPGHITGKIPRNTNLSNVLKIMQLSGVHFKIEDRKVMVLSN